MELLIKAVQFILSLSFLIILHELGHFIPARLFKTRVDKFFLFFDYKFALFKKKIGKTVYGIGWIPLGGYVKIAGMVDESMDKGHLDKAPQPWEYRSKPAWQRLIIILGGVIVNFILGILIYGLLLFFNGESYIVNKSLKDGVLSGKLGETIGLKTGDRIVAIDGAPVKKFDAINGQIITANQVTVEREGILQKKQIPVDFIEKLIEQERSSIVDIRLPFFIGTFTEQSPNKDSGLQKGDLITAINDVPVKYADQIIELFKSYPNRSFTLTVKRGGEIAQHQVTTDDKGRIGVYRLNVPWKKLQEMGYFKIEQHHYGFFEAIPKGIEKGWAMIMGYVKQLKKIFNPKTGAYKGVGGFISIGKIFPNTWNWTHFWSITAFLSIMLGVLNLLPIPGLDGGYVVFILYEMVTRRKPDEKLMGYAQAFGFILLILLLLFANGNDVIKLFS